MRDADRVECAAMGRTPKGALRIGLRGSSMCCTATVDGRPEAMFGLVVTNALGGEGTPWLLGTDAVYDHPRAMLRMGRRILNRMADSTATLSNLVAAENSRAIRFLRAVGFIVEEQPVMYSDVAFLPFTRERR